MNIPTLADYQRVHDELVKNMRDVQLAHNHRRMLDGLQRVAIDLDELGCPCEDRHVLCPHRETCWPSPARLPVYMNLILHLCEDCEKMLAAAEFADALNSGCGSIAHLASAYVYI